MKLCQVGEEARIQICYEIKLICAGQKVEISPNKCRSDPITDTHSPFIQIYSEPRYR